MLKRKINGKGKSNTVSIRLYTVWRNKPRHFLGAATTKIIGSSYDG
jgi:hypothetical protein